MGSPRFLPEYQTIFTPLRSRLAGKNVSIVTFRVLCRLMGSQACSSTKVFGEGSNRGSKNHLDCSDSVSIIGVERKFSSGASVLVMHRPGPPNFRRLFRSQMATPQTLSSLLASLLPQMAESLSSDMSSELGIPPHVNSCHPLAMIETQPSSGRAALLSLGCIGLVPFRVVIGQKLLYKSTRS